jgi:transcriptional regulator with XRE-family HTH domain
MRAALSRMAIEAGQGLRAERQRRTWSLATLAHRAGMSTSAIQAIEAGRPGTLDSYARLATALGLRPSLLLTDARLRRAGAHRGDADAQDLVHAAMGEAEARALAGPGRTLAIDEPYQHYQFAGRADLAAWDLEDRSLLHIENRTRFPNLQEAAGSYNAKRGYLARALAERLELGPLGWRSVTHVMACLWSAEVIHTLRLRQATFGALCPDPPDAFAAWLGHRAPPPGTTSTLVLLDPLVPFGSRRRTIGPLADIGHLDPRYRGYAAAADALRRAAVQSALHATSGGS